MLFTVFITLVIIQRLAELAIAKRNERWVKQQGAMEYGKEHYPFIVALHTLFIFSIIFEYIITPDAAFHLSLMIIWFVLIGMKAWVISTLGKYWNTKIFRVPNAPLINKGLYRYIKHPNYIIVICEIAIIPMVFNLFYTAVVFSILNMAMLYFRIRVEDRALAS